MNTQQIVLLNRINYFFKEVSNSIILCLFNYDLLKVKRQEPKEFHGLNACIGGNETHIYLSWHFLIKLVLSFSYNLSVCIFSF